MVQRRHKLLVENMSEIWLVKYLDNGQGLPSITNFLHRHHPETYVLLRNYLRQRRWPCLQYSGEECTRVTKQVLNVDTENLKTNREASFDPETPAKTRPDTPPSQKPILNLVPYFPSNLSKHIDKTRYIYVTSLLESSDV